MRPLLRVLLSPWFTLVTLAAALLLLLLGFMLRGTLNVVTVAHFTLIQYGDAFTIGSPRGTIIRSTPIWVVALLLALPAMAWVVWFAIHLDAKE